MVTFCSYFDELENWDKGRVVILRGEAGCFCSGADLAMLQDRTRTVGFFAYILSRLSNLPLVSVALVQGYALGGGAEMALACDLRVMSPAAKIGLIHVKRGVCSSMGATTRLVQRLGRSKTAHVVCSGSIYKADEAKDIGLVDVVLSQDSDDEMRDTEAWVKSQFGAIDSAALRACKRLVCDIAGENSRENDREKNDREIDTFLYRLSCLDRQKALDTQKKAP